MYPKKCNYVPYNTLDQKEKTKPFNYTKLLNWNQTHIIKLFDKKTEHLFKFKTEYYYHKLIMRSKMMMIQLSNLGIIILLIIVLLTLYLESGIAMFNDPDDCILFFIWVGIIVNSIYRISKIQKIKLNHSSLNVIPENPKKNNSKPVTQKNNKISFCANPL